MRTTVHLPQPLRPLAKDRERVRVDVDGATVGDLLVELQKKHPDLAAALLDDQGALRRSVTLYVGDDDIRRHGGMQAPLSSDVTIIVPLVL